MSWMMVTSTVKPEKVADVEAAVGAVFDALTAGQQADVRYISLKGSDGVTFVAILDIAEGTENPLPSMPSFREFQSRLPDWIDGPPATDQMTVVGSYGFLDQPSAEGH